MQVDDALAHDITEIRPDEFKDRAFWKGHVVRPENIEHLKRLRKNIELPAAMAGIRG